MDSLRFFLNIFFLLLIFPSTAQVFFEDGTISQGLDNTTYGSGTLGGGISFFDFDKDGWDDITLSTQNGEPVRFFKNNAGVFQEVFLAIDDPLAESKTVQWVDFNNNGWYDLFITHINSPDRLFKNLGNGNFEDITQSAGLYVEDFLSFGSSWGDINNDGLLDLFVCTRNVGNQYNLLYLNNGNETFTEIAISAGLHDVNLTSFCAVFFDYDKDGFQDIYLANDKLEDENVLYKNNGDLTFSDVSVASGTNVLIDAMSTTIDDSNNDGFLDIYVTNTPSGNVFLKNNNGLNFTDVAPTNGTLFESIGWGAVFLDADLDGYKDLFVSGMIYDHPTLLASAFYHNDGNGQFSIPTNSGIENDNAISFANAIGDVLNNGRPDIAILNYAPFDTGLWLNESPTENNWLKVKLQGTSSNRMGIGSFIEISINGQSQYNYTLCGEGYLGQNSSYEFFGLAEATEIDYIKVNWLSGEEDFIENPPINTSITIVEGEGILQTSDFSETFFEFYPNPANDKVYFNLDMQLNELNITLYTTSGKLIKSSTITASNPVLVLPKLHNGLYILKAEADNFLKTEKLIIKNK